MMYICAAYVELSRTKHACQAVSRTCFTTSCRIVAAAALHFTDASTMLLHMAPCIASDMLAACACSEQ